MAGRLPHPTFAEHLIRRGGFAALNLVALLLAACGGGGGTSDPGGARSLNDTGITACGDYVSDGGSLQNNDLECAAVGATITASGTDGDGDPVPAGQDAHFGRDANPLTNSDADGYAGFSFTKLDSSGNPLVDQSADYATTPWSCVLDNVTGLMWEVKTDDGGLHDKDGIYRWRNTDPATNGGDEGSTFNDCWDGLAYIVPNDTEEFVAAVNAVDLCGHSDWRMPAREELQSILHLGRMNPVIDTSYFPNTTKNWYWSSSSLASDAYYAWPVNFANGDSSWAAGKGCGFMVRLVRAGQ